MVTRSLKPAILASFLAFTLLSGCGLQRWWGEDIDEPRTVSGESQKSSSPECREWTRILEGGEEESRATFECWVGKTSDLWTKVRGETPNRISDRELAVLIRRGIIEVTGDRERIIRRLMTIKDLFGMNSGVSKDELDDWISWSRDHRARIRQTYTRFFAQNEGIHLSYSDLQSASGLLDEISQRLHWKKSPAELGEALKTLLDPQDPGLRSAMTETIGTTMNLLSAVCPTLSDPKTIHPPEIGRCASLMSAHFLPASAWFEWLTHTSSGLSADRAALIQNSLSETEKRVKTWFERPELRPIDTRQWFDWAKAIGAQPPEDFIESLAFIRRFKGRSTENAIDPTEMIRVFSVIKRFELARLQGAPVFMEALRQGKCSNPDATDWIHCELADLSSRRNNPAIDSALRVKNTRHGRGVAPFDGRAFSTIQLFDAIAEQIVIAFDDNGDKIVTTRLSDGSDEIMRLIAVSVQTYQSLDRYLSNLGKRLGRKALFAATLETSDSIDLKQWDMKGLARLLAMASETLVQRTPEERNFLEQLFANLTNSFPAGSTFLDRSAITAVLTSIDALSFYRSSYFKTLGIENEDLPVPRSLFRERLPELLAKTFPRTAESCTRFGFAKSCALAFDEVVPAMGDDKASIRPRDLDIITILGMTMEGIFDGCDRNGDFMLSMKIFDGNDELDCGFGRMKSITQRLVDSEIVKVSPNQKAALNFYLESLNSVFLLRTTGKLALVQGTRDALFLDLPVINLPAVMLSGNATVGSAYGLFSDIVARPRKRAAPNQKK